MCVEGGAGTYLEGTTGSRGPDWISWGMVGYTSHMVTIDPMITGARALPTQADTVFLDASYSFLATAEAVSTILLTVAVLGVLVALVLLLLEIRKTTTSLARVTGRVEQDARPVLERAKGVAENLEFISAAVRTDVQKVNESVARLNDRLREASERMEERIQDFTALVEVLQAEAEDLALDTAAAVRGVRAGTRTFANGVRPSEEGQERHALPLLASEEDR